MMGRRTLQSARGKWLLAKAGRGDPFQRRRRRLIGDQTNTDGRTGGLSGIKVGPSITYRVYGKLATVLFRALETLTPSTNLEVAPAE